MDNMQVQGTPMGQEEQAEQEETGDEASPPPNLEPKGGQPSTSTITGNENPLCKQQGLVESGSYRGSVGKRRHPRPISR